MRFHTLYHTWLYEPTIIDSFPHVSGIDSVLWVGKALECSSSS
jgi:hypothetical protein